jgi:tRNA G10  N-methylase Trm11
VGTTSQQYSITVVFYEWLQGQQHHFKEQELAAVKHIFNKDIHGAENLDKSLLQKLIVSYNPSLGNAMEVDEEMLGKRIIRYYFSNDNFFSRILIVWYLEQTGMLKRFSLINELYEAGDFAIRKEIIAALSRMHYEAAENESPTCWRSMQPTAGTTCWNC